MSKPDRQADDSASSLGELPELNRAVLDWATIESLFCDVASLTQVVEVLVKTGAQSHVENESIGLDQALDLLRTRKAAGVQLRYGYQGIQWWDTLMWRGDQVHLVRIQHDFKSSAKSST